MQTKDVMLSSMVGCAVGDAYGLPYEFTKNCYVCNPNKSKNAKWTNEDFSVWKNKDKLKDYLFYDWYKTSGFGLFREAKNFQSAGSYSDDF